MHHHPGVAKAWVGITNDGSIESPDYNVASITDNNTGNRAIVWDTDFSDVIYALGAAGLTGNNVFIRHSSRAVGSVVHQTIAADQSGYEDASASVIAFGDQ